MDCLKPYYPDLKGKSVSFLYYRPQSAPEDGNWQVEKILKHRTIDGRMEWLVKWKGMISLLGNLQDNLWVMLTLSGEIITNTITCQLPLTRPLPWLQDILV